jgi:daunorubicin resistance ABC transporter membrane protein
MQSAFKVFGGGDVPYVKFMFPGILGMTVLFTAVFSAISIIWDREFGFLKEVLVSPVPRSSVALGKIIGGSTTALMQAVVFLALAFTPWFYGFSLSTLWKVLAVLPLLVLLALSLTSLGVAVAARMTSFEGFPIVMNFLLMPLFFLSGAFFPLQGLPTWMNFLNKIDPLTYGVDALRGIMLRGINLGGASSSLSQYAAWFQDPQILQIGASKGYPDPSALSSMGQKAALSAQAYPLWLDITVMIGFGALLFVLALWQFNRAE